MRISIAYPPIETDKGVPLLSQNRQFQYFSEPTYIYPMVPASAATILHREGHEVLWDDGIAEGLSSEEWMDRLTEEKPDIIVMETKTPVIYHHWEWTRRLKRELPEAQLVLVGDHVTALPEESMRKSEVDFILTGGDYDFLLKNLVDHLTSGNDLEPGIWYHHNGDIRNTGKFSLEHDIGSLPPIDRDLTRWRLYTRVGSNFKYQPATYIMAGRDCWYHRCVFCSWPTLYPKWRVRPPEAVVQEVGTLIDRYGIREVFDDTGTFPVGQWLRRFCQGMVDSGLSERVSMGCNMRVDGIRDQETWDLMRRGGFRFVLFGMESANQSTLDRLNKGTKVEDIVNACRMAKKAGLEPHVTIMVGYPWETAEEVKRTIDFTRELFKKGWIDTLQATIVVPYPGTPYFEECKRNGWLRTLDWSRYDMRENVVQCPLSDKEIKEATQAIYKAFFNIPFAWRKLTSIRSWDDVKFILKGVKYVIGHLRDFA